MTLPRGALCLPSIPLGWGQPWQSRALLGEVFALAPPYLSSPGCAPSRCSHWCDCSGRILCKKTPLAFSRCEALAVSHRSSFCSGLAAMKCWRASGRTDVLSSHRLGQTFTAQCGLRFAVHWGCAFLQRLLFVLLPPWQSRGTNVVSLCTCLPEERALVWGSLGSFGVDVI